MFCSGLEVRFFERHVSSLDFYKMVCDIKHRPNMHLCFLEVFIPGHGRAVLFSSHVSEPDVYKGGEKRKKKFRLRWKRIEKGGGKKIAF